MLKREALLVVMAALASPLIHVTRPPLATTEAVDYFWEPPCSSTDLFGAAAALGLPIASTRVPRNDALEEAGRIARAALALKQHETVSSVAWAASDASLGLAVLARLAVADLVAGGGTLDGDARFHTLDAARDVAN